MQDSILEKIRLSVSHAWGHEHPDETKPPEPLHNLAEQAIEEVFQGVDLLHTQVVTLKEEKEEHWALVLEGDMARLARLTDEAFEIKYLGPLMGSQYRETWRDGGQVDVQFDHPLFSLHLERVSNEVREVFRWWAEAPCWTSL